MWFIDYARDTYITHYRQKLVKVATCVDKSEGETRHFPYRFVVGVQERQLPFQQNKSLCLFPQQKA